MIQGSSDRSYYSRKFFEQLFISRRVYGSARGRDRNANAGLSWVNRLGINHERVTTI